MKTNSRFSKWVLGGVTLAAVAGSCALLTAGKSTGRYTAHEWGTFTSVQGGDGVLLDWRPLESSRLPGFVYDWRKPGLNRQPISPMAFSKGGMLTLQRMETPVIYFYSKQEETVDVGVDFPLGLITEWYPQACQIGPSAMPTPPAIAKLDEYARKAGAKSGFSFASWFGSKNVKESRARWVNVHILPETQAAEVKAALPFDKSASHYFAARDTEANYLRLSSLSATNPSPEHEKFIFYRGVGSFQTPLRVTMNPNRTVTIANTSSEPLSHLFVLGLENRAGKFIRIDRLAAGKQLEVQMQLQGSAEPMENVSHNLEKEMAASLTSEGLYPREASAMVNTWKDSWFAEDGVRVLYVLPRAWTDQTLPLHLDPAPKELVRVMVGRAEVIPPTQQQKLSDALVRAKAGDSAAREEVVAEFKRLGRFAEPAMRLATKGTGTEMTQAAWTLLQAATRPTPQTKPL